MSVFIEEGKIYKRKSSDERIKVITYDYANHAVFYSRLGYPTLDNVKIHSDDFNKKFDRYDEIIHSDELIKENPHNRDDVMSYNVGDSNYAQKKIQPWDIWEEYSLDPWDADIVKRILRDKSSQSRREDYEKIKHVCDKQISRIDNANKPENHTGFGIQNIALYNQLNDNTILGYNTKSNNVSGELNITIAKDDWRNHSKIGPFTHEDK